MCVCFVICDRWRVCGWLFHEDLRSTLHECFIECSHWLGTQCPCEVIKENLARVKHVKLRLGESFCCVNFIKKYMPRANGVRGDLWDRAKVFFWMYANLGYWKLAVNILPYVREPSLQSSKLCFGPSLGISSWCVNSFVRIRVCLNACIYVCIRSCLCIYVRVSVYVCRDRPEMTAGEHSM